MTEPKSALIGITTLLLIVLCAIKLCNTLNNNIAHNRALIFNAPPAPHIAAITPKIKYLLFCSFSYLKYQVMLNNANISGIVYTQVPVYQ